MYVNKVFVFTLLCICVRSSSANLLFGIALQVARDLCCGCCFPQPNISNKSAKKTFDVFNYETFRSFRTYYLVNSDLKGQINILTSFIHINPIKKMDQDDDFFIVMELDKTDIDHLDETKTEPVPPPSPAPATPHEDIVQIGVVESTNEEGSKGKELEKYSGPNRTNTQTTDISQISISRVRGEKIVLDISRILNNCRVVLKPDQNVY